MINKISHKKFFVVAASVGIFGTAFFNYIYAPTPISYSISTRETATTTIKEKKKEEFIVTHIPTPEPLKAIYMTQCVSGTKDFRERLVNLIEKTELNAVVIDIKDYTGKLSFTPKDPTFSEFVSDECGAIDMREFIGVLHKKNIYVIGRITVFQDPYYSKKYPHLAVQKKSDKTLWKDRKGISYVDPGAKEMWDYMIRLSKSAYATGFDELNYDYVRFPSDGDMKDIYFPQSNSILATSTASGKAVVIRDFFAHLSKELGVLNAPLSADLFGMTTTNKDDLNIGQIIEYAEPYFDYIAPMVYPSHYPPTFIGFANPAEHPYEIIKYSMDSAVRRFIAASSTPMKLRPWLQDFNLGAEYTADMVRAQIQATYDAGLTSWMLWDAGNTYTEEALLPE